MTLLPANYDEASIAVVSLADQQTKVVLERAGLCPPRYVPTGHITSEGTLFAVL